MDCFLHQSTSWKSSCLPPRDSSGWGKAAPHYLHLLSSTAISYISHGIRIIRHITSSVLVKLGKFVPFLAEVTVKASNKGDARLTTAPSGRKAAFQDSFLQRTRAVGNALAFQVHQTSKFQWHIHPTLLPLHQTAFNWKLKLGAREHFRSPTAHPHNPSVMWRLRARSCYIQPKV